MVLFARLGRAAPAEFGARGQWVIDEGFGLLAAHGASSSNEPGYSFSSIRLKPSAAVFVLPRFSVGLGLELGHSTISSEPAHQRNTQNELAVRPSIGYAIRLGERFDWWPEIGLRFSERWISVSGDQRWKGRTWGLDVLAAAPVLWRPVPHFFVGVGPTWSRSFYADESLPLSPSYETFGVMSKIGGYFGG